MENQRTAQRHLFEDILDNDPARVRMSIESGANPNAVDHDVLDLWRLFSFDKLTGSFPLYEAVHLASKRKTGNDDVEVIRILLQYGANVNQVDDSGYSATHKAAALNNTQALTLLINSGADLNMRSEKGYTPIHTAIYGEAESCVRILLARGASINCINVAGLSSLQYAKKLGRNDIGAMIESHVAMQTINNMMDTIGMSGIVSGTHNSQPIAVDGAPKTSAASNILAFASARRHY